ncbi:HlyD family secretion protein [Devosia limi]|uniref:Barrel-sandwich domain of CusB or HlyD membrane-fusion n=2 Tax=Devosia limi DSM 17137 TaxID=1121477 RepID=A0A1M4SN05_9HYPH|nr:HlyD family secretion protein [Devosia limi]SHE33357.1 Barrel-sandwich domain of CusB or HlyD membrane-fusion [Devosia limi DSM 17137]
MTQGKDMMEDKGEATTGVAANANVVTLPGGRAKDIEAVPAPSAAPLSQTDAMPPPAPATNKSRKKAKLFGIGVLVTLGALVAWYPLSDHYAPYASGASITAQVTQIAPRVAGPVQHLLIADNAEVKAGQPLFQIDDSTFRMDVAQAQAQLDQALNSVSAGVAAIPAAEAKLAQAEVALLTAEQDLDRTTQLHQSGLVSVAKFNTADANHQTAQLNVEAARAEVERVKLTANTNDGNNPNLRTAQAVLDKAEFALANTTVLAPADGYISNLSLAEGQFVAAGTPAMTFINPKTQMIIADLRENQLVNVQPGDRAIVAFEAAPGRQFEATVDSIAWGINSGRTTVNGLAQSSNDTRWFPPARKVPVRVSIDDMSALPGSVRLGSEASVLIIPEDGLIPTIARTLMGLGSMLSGFN